MTVVAGAVAALTAALFGIALGARSLASLALSTYVLTAALIVGEVEALSGFRSVTAWTVLVVQAVLLVVAAAVVRASGRSPRIRMPRGVGAAVRGQPAVAVLLAIVVAAIGYELALALLTPPNNWDSMTYHLSRAAAWYQHGGVAYVDSHTERENANPYNAEILVLYTFLFAHDDRFAACWQWLAQCASMLAIFVVARRAGSTAGQALFGSLLFACLAQVALQSVTTQNDLLVASFLVRQRRFSPEPRRPDCRSRRWRSAWR